MCNCSATVSMYVHTTGAQKQSMHATTAQKCMQREHKKQNMHEHRAHAAGAQSACTLTCGLGMRETEIAQLKNSTNHALLQSMEAYFVTRAMYSCGDSFVARAMHSHRWGGEVLGVTRITPCRSVAQIPSHFRFCVLGLN